MCRTVHQISNANELMALNYLISNGHASIRVEKPIQISSIDLVNDLEFLRPVSAECLDAPRILRIALLCSV